MSVSPDPYSVLFVDRNSSMKEIKSAYRELVKTFHPDSCDLGIQKRAFQAIQDAYEQIGTPEKRLRTDPSWTGPERPVPMNTSSTKARTSSTSARTNNAGSSGRVKDYVVGSNGVRRRPKSMDNDSNTFTYFARFKSNNLQNLYDVLDDLLTSGLYECAFSYDVGEDKKGFRGFLRKMKLVKPTYNFISLGTQFEVNITRVTVMTYGDVLNELNTRDARFSSLFTRR